MKSYERIISQEQVRKIHENSLKILSEIGVNFENETALEVFRKAGARIENNKVFIDEKLVSQALKDCPSSFEIKGRDGSKVNYGSGALSAASIGSPAFISEKGKIRKMTTKDAINQFKMNETSALTSVSDINRAVMNDQPLSEPQRVLGSLAFCLKYSQKAITYCKIDVNEVKSDTAFNYCSKAVEMIQNYYETDGIVTLIIVNPISPLTYDNSALEKIMGLSSKGQIIVPTPCAMPILTAPPSVAGLLAQTNAEILAGIVFTQLYNPGTPIVYANTSASTDMKKIQLSIAAPEAVLMCYATAALADFYHLPFRTGGGLSDAKQLDVQAGAESMMMLYATYDLKPDFIYHTLGCLGIMNLLSLEKFITDEETIMYVQRIFRGIDTTPERFCVEALRKAGPRGTFVNGRTPKMYREEFVLCNLFDKDDPNNWQNSGATSVFEKASQQVKERLDSCTLSFYKEKGALVDSLIPDGLQQSI